MTNTNRTHADHFNDMRELNEALAFFAKELGKPTWIVTSDYLALDRSYYGVRDETGVYKFGEVEKTAKMWKFTSADGIVIRTKKVDMLAVRAL